MGDTQPLRKGHSVPFSDTATPSGRRREEKQSREEDGAHIMMPGLSLGLAPGEGLGPLCLDISKPQALIWDFGVELVSGVVGG